MHTYIKDQKYYEDLYDSFTVKDARWGIKQYEKFYAKLEKKLPKDDTIDRPGNVMLLNMFYLQAVGLELLHDYEERDSCIKEWMSRDEAKDLRIANARLVSEPICQHCGKTGLRITDKSLMHRGKDYERDNAEEILFMLKCPHCQKNSAYWEDGSEWERIRTYCPKCKSEMSYRNKSTKNKVTTTYDCQNCGHTYDEVINLTKKTTVEELVDPDFEKDRMEYCLHNNVALRDRLYATKKGIEGLAELGKKFKEKEDNKQIYDAVKEIKKPKIAELIPLLTLPLEKAGYREFSLDKPEMGRDVVVGFNCLDAKSERDNYTSQKELKKIIEKVLRETNWRLMSEGIHYRLGYLNGRIRAYEREEDLIKLVEKDKKLKYRKSEGGTGSDEAEVNASSMLGVDGRRIKF